MTELNQIPEEQIPTGEQGSETKQDTKTTQGKKKGLWIVFGVVGLILILSVGGFLGLRGYEKSLLSDIEKAEQDGQWELVLENAEKGINLSPQQILIYQDEFQFKKAVAYQQLDHPDTKEQLMLVFETNPEYIEGYIYLAAIALEENDLETAKSYAEEARKLDDSQGLFYAIEAYEYFLNNQYFEADQAAQFALDRNEDLVLAKKVKGMVAYWSVDHQKAADYLESVVEQKPNDVDSLAYLVLIYENLQKFDLQKETFDVLMALESDKPECKMAEAFMAYKNYNRTEAFEIIQEVMEAAPNRHDFQFIYAYLDPYQESEINNLDMVSKIYEENPQFIQAYITKELILWNRYEHVNKVENTVEKISELAPNSDQDQLLMFNDLSRGWYLDDALELINEMIEENPNNWVYYTNRGDIFYMMNMEDEAMADYEKASEISQDPFHVLINEAYFLLDQKKYDEAIIKADEGLEIFPESQTIRRLKASAYMRDEELDLAKEMIDEALAIDPNNVSTLLLEADYYIEKEDTIAAMASVNKAAEYEPKNPAINSERGYIYLGEEEYDLAFNEGQKAFNNGKRDISGLFVKANALLGQDRIEAAESEANQIVRICPYSKAGYYMLAGIQNMLGKHGEALENADHYITIDDQEPQIYLTRYSANFGLGDTEAAAEDLEKALSFEDELELDDLDFIETAMKYLEYVPPMVDGLRHFVHDDLDFMIDYGGDWLPAVVQDETVNVYVLENRGSELRIIVNDPDDESIGGINPSLLLQFFREEYFSGPEIKFITQEKLSVDGRYWLADVFQVEPGYYEFDLGMENLEWGLPATLKLYVFVDKNRWVVIEYVYLGFYNSESGPDFAFGNPEEVDEFVKTFEFIY